jgi:hypothetical protein
VLHFRPDYYAKAHPNGGDAALVIEAGDSERNPREKMRAYMRDGRIPNAWRVDIPNRCVELWEPSNVEQPIAIRRGAEVFGFEVVTFPSTARLQFGEPELTPTEISFEQVPESNPPLDFANVRYRDRPAAAFWQGSDHRFCRRRSRQRTPRSASARDECHADDYRRRISPREP